MDPGLDLGLPHCPGEVLGALRSVTAVAGLRELLGFMSAVDVVGEGPGPPRVPPQNALFTVPLSPAGGDPEVFPQRRLYTVSLPPEGYAPAPPEPQASPASDDSSGSDDPGGECHLSGEAWFCRLTPPRFTVTGLASGSLDGCPGAGLCPAVTKGDVTELIVTGKQT